METLNRIIMFLNELGSHIFLSRAFRIYLFLAYFVSQNSYYGWHMKPQSELEVVSDGIHVLLLMLACWPSAVVKVVINQGNDNPNA